MLQDDTLVGFVSIFPHDCDERPNLSPWYATMYVKEEFRGNGYSKLLNDAILKEAKSRGFTKIYLKTDLINYYEKFGANYIETLKSGEKLYYFNLSIYKLKIIILSFNLFINKAMLNSIWTMH